MDEMIKRFRHHPPRDERTVHHHETVRAACLHLAKTVERFVPAGREQSLALTQIEQAMFWANAGIARSAAVEAEVAEMGPLAEQPDRG
jgi:hypothetical protein